MRPIALHGHTRAITRVKYNKDGDLLFSTAKDTSPTVWDAETGERLGTYEGHTGAVWDCDINFTSTLFATAGADGHVKIWDLRIGECVATFGTSGSQPVRCVGFSHGDNMLLTVTDKSFGANPAIHIFNLPEGGTPRSIKESKTAYNPFITHEAYEKITCALWGPTNDTIYFSSEDGTLAIYNVSRQMEETFCGAHRSEVKRFCFDKNYVTLLTASSDQSSLLLDAMTLKVLKKYESDKPINDCAFSPTMEHVILGGGQDAQSVTNVIGRANRFETRFFHKIYQEELGSITGHFGPVNALAFNPTGRSFSSGGEDGFVRMHHFDEEYFHSGETA
jgi:translation initiation factor 3 subunit I